MAARRWNCPASLDKPSPHHRIPDKPRLWYEWVLSTTPRCPSPCIAIVKTPKQLTAYQRSVRDNWLSEYRERWKHSGRYSDVYRSLVGAATMHGLHPEFLTTKWQRRAGLIRHARKAHDVIRASGRRCCQEACLAAAEKRRRERERKEKERLYSSAWRTSQANLDGI